MLTNESNIIRLIFIKIFMNVNLIFWAIFTEKIFNLFKLYGEM